MTRKITSNIGHDQRLHEFIKLYRSRLVQDIKSQIKDEAYKGYSTKQYNYGMILAAFRMCYYISELSNFTPFDELYTRYNIKYVTRVLANIDVDFDKILAIYNLPKKSDDDTNIDSINIGTSSISSIKDYEFVTLGYDRFITVTPSIIFSRHILTGSIVDKTATVVSNIKEFTVTGLYSTAIVDFLNFSLEYPVILIPTDGGMQIQSIREYESNYLVTEGYVFSGMTYDHTFLDDGVVRFNVYVYDELIEVTDNKPYNLKIDTNIVL